MAVLPPLLHVYYQFGNSQKAANKALIDVCKTEEDLDIEVAHRFLLLGNHPHPGRFHLNAFRRDDKADKTNTLHFKFASGQLQV